MVQGFTFYSRALTTICVRFRDEHEVPPPRVPARPPSCAHHESPSRGEGREPPAGDSRRRRWPGVTPGVGTHRDGHRPGVDTHCPGWGRLTLAPTVRVFDHHIFLERAALRRLLLGGLVVLARVLDEGGIAIWRAGGGGVNSGISPWASEQILVHELPFAPEPTCPGSTPRGRDSPGHWPARGRPGVGTHFCILGSPCPGTTFTLDESPGIPDPPPYSGFRA
jgi:hypothetical protein